jgi:misacylated tRNA(Ala) deacylase
VNGCSITPEYARLDFNMTDPLDKEALTQGIAHLVSAAHAGRSAPSPTRSSTPTRRWSRACPCSRRAGLGGVRTIRIGSPELAIDFQPLRRHACCKHGGDRWRGRHQIEKKSASTRRVVLGFS